MKRAIITPTFSGHFCFIEKYLESFDRYLQDKEFAIYFVINKSEKGDLFRIIKKYTEKLNINVVFLEDIFHRYNIEESPEEALRTYGRLSFQTLKKFYAARYINADQWLFLDSETMLIKPTNFTELFDEYFESPHFFISRISDRAVGYKDGFTYEFLKAVDAVFGKEPEYWSIESYEWFYDKQIFDQMITDIGEPITIIRNYKLPGKFKNVEGILEALLYYQYILYNNKFNYNIYVIEDELRRYLGEKPYKKLKKAFDKGPYSICGFLEVCSFYIDKSMAKGFTDFLNDHRIRILRIEDPKVNNANAQVEFVNNSGVICCPSSQHHIFGINANTKTRKQILIKENKNYIKFKEHYRSFINPFKFVARWTVEPLLIIKYGIKLLLLKATTKNIINESEKW